MNHTVSELRRLGAATLVLGALGALLTMYALHSALPANPIELPLAAQLEVRAWLPEGWAFFTAPPQSDTRVPYVRVADRWESASFGPNAQARNAFGLRRNARLQNLELEALLEQAPKAAWVTCDRPASACFDELAKPVYVRNTSFRPTLCGEVAIPVHKPVPWAWSHLPQDFEMPTTALRMSVQC